jgi:predicted DCC family thiol-disulfide oxidoreductase YuxK
MICSARCTNGLGVANPWRGAMDQSVVLYDGRCAFCTDQIAHLRRLDTRGKLRFLSLHDPQVAIQFPDLSHDQLMAQMWIVDPRGGRHGGAYALRFLSRTLPLLWPLAPLLHVPGMMPLWSWMYRQVAQRRYRIAGRRCDGDTCSLHSHPTVSPPQKDALS